MGPGSTVLPFSPADLSLGRNSDMTVKAVTVVPKEAIGTVRITGTADLYGSGKAS